AWAASFFPAFQAICCAFREILDHKTTRFIRFYRSITCFSGSTIYPWYRAVPPSASADLSMFPQRLLMSSPTTIGWHSLGMEWKEHVAWIAPMSITMVAFVFIRYGRDLRNHSQLRAAVLCFTLVSFLAAGIAGLFGALINKQAPVQGGNTMRLSAGGEK
ncbi:MAG: hypothetical protein WBE76_02715, partial [Terracidiphilus sp.]